MTGCNHFGNITLKFVLRSSWAGQTLHPQRMILWMCHTSDGPSVAYAVVQLQRDRLGDLSSLLLSIGYPPSCRGINARVFHAVTESPRCDGSAAGTCQQIHTRCQKSHICLPGLRTVGPNQSYHLVCITSPSTIHTHVWRDVA